MNEKETKAILKKSTIETSDDFTDKLIRRIETKAVAEKTMVWRFVPMFSILLVAILVVSITFYKYLESSTKLFDFSMGKTPLFLAAIVLLLLAINYILKLNETYRISKTIQSTN